MTIKKVAISLCLLIKTECKWTKWSNQKKKEDLYIGCLQEINYKTEHTA